MDYAGVWYVAWGNPFTRGERPEKLAEEVFHPWRGQQPPERLIEIARANPGYCLAWTFRPLGEPHRWSQQAKARERQRRLRERMERKYPLFAEMFIAEALAKKPGYYAGEEVPYVPR